MHPSKISRRLKAPADFYPWAQENVLLSSQTNINEAINSPGSTNFSVKICNYLFVALKTAHS